MEEDIRKLRQFLEELKSPDSPLLPCSSGTKRPCEESVPETELKDLEYCLRRNEACRSFMTESETHLRTLLDECTKEKRTVCENITTVQSGKSSERKYHKIHIMCSTPYFKDPFGFPAPVNKDVALRESCGIINLCNVRKSVPWTEEQKKIVLDSIRESEIERWTKIAKKAGTEKFCDFQSKTLTELIGSRKDEYDWMKISVIDLKNSRTPFECRAVWFNYLHPAINKAQWTEEEDTALLQLIEKHNHEDWDKIAEELNTNRSAYQCIGHYNCRLKDFSSLPWTEEENDIVREYVAKYSVGGYIPWAKVAWHLDGRSQTAISRHWEYINPDTKKGRYSLEEDIIIAVGFKYYGPDYCKIAEYLPNRTNVQVRARVQILRSHQNGVIPWTPQEDRLLCEKVKKFGYGNWSKISTQFVNRTSGSCRSRYLGIMTWKEKHGPDSMPLASKVFSNYHGTLDELWENAKKVVRERHIFTTAEILPDEKLVNDLSKVLLWKQKPGRPPGGRPPEFLDREFYQLFCSCYQQKGGRGKNLVSQELLPYMVKDTIITLNLVKAKLTLPEDTETIENDYHLMEVDKIFLKFVINQKELVNNIYQLLNRDTNPGNIPYLCPPNYTTLVGLRTLLLKRRSLKEQARGGTLIPYVNPGESSTGVRTTSDRFKAASKLWKDRLHFLFTWAALASKKYPNQACPLTPESPLKFHSYGYKEERRQERIRKKKPKPIKYGKPPELRRAYNKTGKYKISGDPNGCIRRSSRLSRGAEGDTEQ